jgi:hypothetical protein
VARATGTEGEYSSSPERAEYFMSPLRGLTDKPANITCGDATGYLIPSCKQKRGKDNPRNHTKEHEENAPSLRVVSCDLVDSMTSFLTATWYHYAPSELMLKSVTGSHSFESCYRSTTLLT